MSSSVGESSAADLRRRAAVALAAVLAALAALLAISATPAVARGRGASRALASTAGAGSGCATSASPAVGTSLGESASDALAQTSLLSATYFWLHRRGGIATGGSRACALAAKPAVEGGEIFTIEEFQAVGIGEYTQGELTATIEEHVHYRVVVTNESEDFEFFEAPTDNNPECELKRENVSESTPLARPDAEGVGIEPHGSEAWTCTVKYGRRGQYENEAAIEGVIDDPSVRHTARPAGSLGGEEKVSNPVIVDVEGPEYTIEKFQTIEGSGKEFTSATLNATVGQTVDYAIVVTNTGEFPLEFKDFSDTKCGGISGGPGSAQVEPEERTIYRCSHKFSAKGTYTNEASVEGNDSTGEESSNMVVVHVRAASFTIEKLQRLNGETGYKTTELSAAKGRTVEYEVVLKNSGEVPLTFSNFSDTKCGEVSGGPGSTAVPAGKSTIYKCSHVLSEPGAYTNEASVEGNEGTGAKRSNQVAVFVKAPSFTIEKLQKIAGGAMAFTSGQLKAAVGQTVDYEIVVTNTGNVPLKFESFSDSRCSGVSGGPGSGAVAAGDSTTYTCSHVLSEAGAYSNEASVVGGEGTGKETSNAVTVNADEEQVSVEKLQRAAGETAYGKGPLTGRAPLMIEYEIVVENTGEIPVRVEKIADAKVPGCETTTPPKSEVAVGERAIEATCSHEIKSPGESFKNIATVTAGGKQHTSETVEATTEEKVDFKVEKLQRLAGTGEYTREPLTGKAPFTVEYEIVVVNTGEGPVTVEEVVDADVPACATAAPPTAAVAVGERAVEATCSHELTKAASSFTNVAAVVASAKERESAPVEAKSEATKVEKTEVTKTTSTSSTGSSAPSTIALATVAAGAHVGGTFSLTATVMEGGVAQVGVPVTFTVTGANPQSSSVATDSAGEATFTYTAQHVGIDHVVATFVDKQGQTLVSSEAANTWMALPAPVLGETVNVELVSGSVFIKLPAGPNESLGTRLPGFAFVGPAKGVGFIPLTEARQIPVGSILEASGGVARLTTATAASGKSQFGEFGAGIFTVLQNRAQRGLSELKIMDNRSPKQVCATVGKKASIAKRHLSSKVLGKLNGTAHGGFTTRGQYSAATVRGTVWTVSNRCDGTLTVVQRGLVSVRDFVRRRTILLHTGQRYLAKLP